MSDVQILDTIKVGPNTITIKVSNDEVHAKNYMFAMVKIPTDGDIIVTVDNLYLNSPQLVRDFILYHELGHIFNNKITKVKSSPMILRIFEMYLGIPDINESRADDFAVNVLGMKKCKHALRYMKTKMISRAGKREISIRLNRLIRHS